MPEENGWKLVCTFKDGSFTPVDTSKELVFKNPAHGQDYTNAMYADIGAKILT